MIYYDAKKNKFITINNGDIDYNYRTISNTNNISKECELIIIRFNYSNLGYFNEWCSDLEKRTMLKYSYEYKRDIFISSNEKDKFSKFSNCFLVSINSNDSHFEVTLSCDYYYNDNLYPELNALYLQTLRDEKIDLILK